jgi:hypothetical protein
VADNAGNRAVIAFCERYRKAVENKDVNGLLSMASQSYHDDAGTPDPSDDVRHPDLAQFLQQTLQGAGPIRYEMRYRKIETSGRNIRVTVLFAASYRVPSGEERRTVSDNVLELERVEDGFAILSGM